MEFYLDYKGDSINSPLVSVALTEQKPNAVEMTTMCPYYDNTWWDALSS